jgi:GT2 family glycosyltransferase
LVNEDGTVQPSTHDLPTTRNLLFGALLNRSAWARKRWGSLSFKYWQFDQVREVPFLSGACLMVRRRAISDVGPLDERFRMYTEDVDWCMRMREAGWSIVFLPTATITHLGGKSTTRFHRRYLYYVSLLALSRKHYTLLEHWLPRLYWRIKRTALFVALMVTRPRDLDFVGLRRRKHGV